MRVTVVGNGAVGRRVVEALAQDRRVSAVTVVGRRPVDDGWTGGDKVAFHTQSSAPWERRPTIHGQPDVTVIASPANVVRLARAALDAGSHVVSPVDDPGDVRALIALDRRARTAGRSLAVGTALAPGLSCVLALQLRPGFDPPTEVHVASLGTGGPACARRHHAALAGVATDWLEGAWRRRPAGSGRELVWFPGPVGGADCYRAALADPVLLRPVFGQCRRITARLEATRRDRLTSPLPMMRKPHPEGLVGAVRVEMRGWVAGRSETRILGVATPPAVAAAAVTSVTAVWAGSGRLARVGAAGLAEMVKEPGAFLRELHPFGIAVSAFEGSGVM